MDTCQVLETAAYCLELASQVITFMEFQEAAAVEAYTAELSVLSQPSGPLFTPSWNVCSHPLSNSNGLALCGPNSTPPRWPLKLGRCGITGLILRTELWSGSLPSTSLVISVVREMKQPTTSSFNVNGAERFGSNFNSLMVGIFQLIGCLSMSLQVSEVDWNLHYYVLHLESKEWYYFQPSKAECCSYI